MGLFSRLTAKHRSSPHEPVNFASPEFKANPFPFYTRLRVEAPAYRMTMPTRDIAWLIARYDDVVSRIRFAESSM